MAFKEYKASREPLAVVIFTEQGWDILGCTIDDVLLIKMCYGLYEELKTKGKKHQKIKSINRYI